MLPGCPIRHERSPRRTPCECIVLYAQRFDQDAPPLRDVVHFRIRQIGQMYAVGLAWKDAYRFHRVIPLAMDVLAASKACCSSARAGRLSLGVCVVGSFASMRLTTLPERPIEVGGGAYECQVREGL